MNRRLLSALLLAAIATVAILSLTASDAFFQTYYLKGWTYRSNRSFNAGFGVPDSAIVDSIPTGATYTTPWIQCLGATMVRLEMQGTTRNANDTGADSAVITCAAATIDTSITMSQGAVTVQNISQISSSGSAVGIKVLQSAAGDTDSVAPTATRVVTVLPTTVAAFQQPFIPVRWVKFAVTAPGHGLQCTACQSVRKAKIIVWVYRPFGAFSGAYGNNAGNPDSASGNH